MLPNGLKEILDYEVWKSHSDDDNRFPVFSPAQFEQSTSKNAVLNFVRVSLDDWNGKLLAIAEDTSVVFLLETDNEHALPELRRFFFYLIEKNSDIPVIVKREYPEAACDETLLYSATDVGGLLIDGLGDGIMLSTEKLANKTKAEYLKDVKFLNDTSFGVLQAARTRMSKTEYISCPSCGRTLFDLQETTAKIRKRTDHLKGVKIGIMGCIVNGPGEMADADYGDVGSGKGKITLYKGKEVIKKGIPSESALDELIELIKQDDRWREPEE